MTATAKTCSKCGEVKALDCFGQRKDSTDGKRHTCKVCMNQYFREKAALKRMPAKPKVTSAERRKRQKLWRKKNADHLRSERKLWEANNKESVKQRGLRAAEMLTDRYIKNVIANVDRRLYQEIPQELIALKREQLAIKRMARELKKAATKPTGENE